LSAKGKKARKGQKQPPEGKRKGQGLSLKQRLIKALSHPLRWQILALLNEREWSPNELSEELVEGLSQISYHVKVLKDFEMIELTKEEPRRGAVEHYYRAVERAYLPTGISKNLPQSGRDIIANKVLQDIDKDLGTAIRSRKFYERADHHITWTPEYLDEEGCAKASELADEFVERFIEIGVESANRLAKDKDARERIAITAALLVFPSEYGQGKAAPKKGGRKKKTR
jgi:DNA-binding transcriptional ArsR family regulator